MKTSQSFPFYHADFLFGTALMTCEQVGAYMRLLCHQWEQGALPNDRNLLAKLVATDEQTIEAILPKFRTTSAGKIQNRKLEEVRKSLTLYKKSRSENGKKGGRPKKHMVSQCLTGEKHSESLPSPSPVPFPVPPVTPPCSVADARASAKNQGLHEWEGERWWHTRNGADWLKADGAGGSRRVNAGWQSDLKRFVERMRGTADWKPTATPKADLPPSKRY